jgi:hypothetical protein
MTTDYIIIFLLAMLVLQNSDVSLRRLLIPVKHFFGRIKAKIAHWRHLKKIDFK